MGRAGPTFTFDQLAEALRAQQQAAEVMRTYAPGGDIIPWTGAMGASVTPPPCFASLKGYYVRANDLIVFAFFGTATSSSAGSGVYQLPLPVAPWNSSSDVLGLWMAEAGASRCDGVLDLSAPNALLTYKTANPGTALVASPTQPYTWAAGNTIQGLAIYLGQKGA